MVSVTRTSLPHCSAAALTMFVSARQHGTSMRITRTSSTGLSLRIATTLSNLSRSSSLGHPMITGSPLAITDRKRSMTNAVQSAAMTIVPR